MFNKIWTVFKFEFMAYMKNKKFVGFTVFLLASILIISYVPNIVDMFTNENSTESESGTEPGSQTKKKSGAAIVADETLFTQEILGAFFSKYEWKFITKPDDPEALIQDGTYSVVLVMDSNNIDFTLYQKGNNLGFTDDVYRQMVIAANQQAMIISQPDETQSVIMDIMSINPKISIINVGTDIKQTFWYAYVIIILLFMAIMLYSQFIAISIVTEKSSKTMELLITSTKPTNLLFGKVLGVGCVGLLQFFLLIATGIGAMINNKAAWLKMSPEFEGIFAFKNLTPSLFIYMILFFVLGFFMVAFIYAALASTVDRMEDMNSIAMIPMLIQLGGFYIALIGLFSADALFVKVCSYIPFFSASVMFMRVCVGSATGLEPVISLVVLFFSTIVMGILSAKLYKIGVMLYGKKLGQILFPKKYASK